MVQEFYEPPKTYDEALERIEKRIEEVKSAIRRESSNNKLRLLRETLESNELMFSLILNEKNKSV
jgi:prefoldin subunit 5